MAEDDKGKKPGGKSRMVWILGGVGVGAVVYLWYKHVQANNAASALNATTAGSTLAGAQSSTTALGSALPTSFTDFQSWLQAVQTWGNSTGADPATTQNALQAYSAGTCLSPAEFAIVDKALGMFGSPPEAPFQGLVQCAPSTTTPPPPPAATGNSGPITQFPYLNGTQLQEYYVNSAGQLIHRWTGVTGNWAQEILGSGLTPNSQVTATQGDFGNANRIDISAPTTGGGMFHGWYTPQQGRWGSEVVGRPPSGGVTNNPIGAAA